MYCISYVQRLPSLVEGSLLDAVTAALVLRQAELDGRVRLRLAAAALDGDAVSRLLGLQVLAQARDGWSARVLLDALTSADAGHREHAAWALGGRPPDRRATPAAEAGRRRRVRVDARRADTGALAATSADAVPRRRRAGPGQGEGAPSGTTRMSVAVRRGGANIRFGAAVYGSFLVASVVGVASRPDGNHGPLEAGLGRVPASSGDRSWGQVWGFSGTFQGSSREGFG